MKKGPVFIEKKYFKHFSGHLYFILVAKGSFMHVPLSVNGRVYQDSGLYLNKEVFYTIQILQAKHLSSHKSMDFIRSTSYEIHILKAGKYRIWQIS